jgi:integrase/recombinase XerD
MSNASGRTDRPLPRLAALAEDWLDDKRSSGRGLADTTEAAYRRDLAVWAFTIAELLRRPLTDGTAGDSPNADRAGSFEQELARIEVDDLELDTVRRAAAALARQHYAPASRARMLAALKGFCRWLTVEGHLVQDPTVRQERPGSPQRLPAAFQASELDRIVAAASTSDERARRQWPMRDRALVAVLAGAGLRATELCTLAVGDFIVEHTPLLHVVGKGGKERRVPVAAEIAEALQVYLDERAARFGAPSPTDPLFVGPAGTAMTRQGLNHHVRRWLLRAAVPKPEGEAAHAFRHTYAKGLVSRGAPLSAVQALLGHASLQTTQVYLRMTGAELVDAAQAAEVRDALRATQTRRRAPSDGSMRNTGPVGNTYSTQCDDPSGSPEPVPRV